jgi:hypothetical protein
VGRWLALLGGLVVAGLAVSVATPPVPQDPAYHDFADRRALLGVPFFAYVASNVGFLLVGATGVARLLGRRGAAGFVEPRERRAYAVFFAAILLTAPGSAWYHLGPDNARLVGDRLPMAVAFMALTSAVVAERVHVAWGTRALAPLVAVGVASVAQWYLTETLGRGDLRLYAAVQFVPMLLVPALVVPALVVLRPSPYTHGWAFGGALGLYVAAKACELADRPFLERAGVGGHALKHLLAAGAAGAILLMLVRRARVDSPQGR